MPQWAPDAQSSNCQGLLTVLIRLLKLGCNINIDLLSLREWGLMSNWAKMALGSMNLQNLSRPKRLYFSIRDDFLYQHCALQTHLCLSIFYLYASRTFWLTSSLCIVRTTDVFLSEATLLCSTLVHCNCNVPVLDCTVAVLWCTATVIVVVTATVLNYAVLCLTVQSIWGIVFDYFGHILFYLQILDILYVLIYLPFCT